MKGLSFVGLVPAFWWLVWRGLLESELAVIPDLIAVPLSIAILAWTIFDARSIKFDYKIPYTITTLLMAVSYIVVVALKHDANPVLYAKYQFWGTLAWSVVVGFAFWIDTQRGEAEVDPLGIR